MEKSRVKKLIKSLERQERRIEKELKAYYNDKNFNDQTDNLQTLNFIRTKIILLNVDYLMD